jgi:hypothetical protein
MNGFVMLLMLLFVSGSTPPVHRDKSVPEAGRVVATVKREKACGCRLFRSGEGGRLLASHPKSFPIWLIR